MSRAKGILRLATTVAILVSGGLVMGQGRQTARPPSVQAAAPSYALLPTKVYSKENAPATPKVAELPLKESVSQYGITWTFEKPAPVGQFINGDWYVVGPVTVKMIDPKPLFGDEVKETINKDSVKEAEYAGKQARNGSQLNASPKGRNCAFDSRIPSGRYDPARFAHLPIAMKPGDSLISTISRENSQITKFGGQLVDPLRVAAVLTCVSEPQPADAFRPSYCDSAGSKIYLARNLKRELLLKLPKAAAAPASLDAYARMLQKPWLDLAEFGFAAPIENLPHYGQNMAQQEGDASLLLLMDYPAEQKEPLLVNLIQVGIDFYGMARAGAVWHAHGGLYSGRKWPIVFAGVMLGEPAMQPPEKSIPGLAFGEDDQTAFGPVTYRGEKFEASATGSKVIFMGHSPYLIKPTKEAEEDHFAKGWGLLDVFPPKQWPKRPDGGDTLASEGYRRANTSSSWVGVALAARLMHLEKAWNHDAFFAYVDRWMTQDDSAINKEQAEAGWHDYTQVRAGRAGRQGHVGGSKWVEEMWRKYRDNLPPAADGSKTPPAASTWK